MARSIQNHKIGYENEKRKRIQSLSSRFFYQLVMKTVQHSRGSCWTVKVMFTRKKQTIVPRGGPYMWSIHVFPDTDGST